MRGRAHGTYVTYLTRDIANNAIPWIWSLGAYGLYCVIGARRQYTNVSTTSIRKVRRMSLVTRRHIVSRRAVHRWKAVEISRTLAQVPLCECA